MAAKASIIIPTYNRAATLGRAIESALGQTYTNIEIVVVDDYSTDDTERVVETFKDPRLIYFRQSLNTNIPQSWDTGLRHSTGQYFAFLGDDDVLKPGFVAHRVDCMESNPEAAAVFGHHERRNDDGTLRCTVPASTRNCIDRSAQGLVAAALVVDWFITASMYRRSMVMPAWTAASDDGFVFDVGFNIRIVTQSLGRVVHIPTDDVVVTVHSGQVSCKRQDVMLEQKHRLMTTLLDSELPASLAKPILDEFSNWHVYWGRLLMESNNTAAARRHFLRAIRVRPFRLHTWKQTFKSFLRRNDSTLSGRAVHNEMKMESV